MAWSKTETQIQWASADTKSVAAGGTETSDALTLQADTVNAFLKCYASNDATAASGDDVAVAIQYGGDPNADGTENYDSLGDFVTNLDTNEADPAVRTIPIVPIQGETLQIAATNNAGSNSITVGFTVVEERWS